MYFMSFGTLIIWIQYGGIKMTTIVVLLQKGGVINIVLSLNTSYYIALLSIATATVILLSLSFDQPVWSVQPSNLPNKPIWCLSGLTWSSSHLPPLHTIPKTKVFKLATWHNQIIITIKEEDGYH